MTPSASPDPLQFELDTVADLGGPPARRLQNATRKLAALYIRMAGGLDQPLPPDRQLEYRIQAAEIIYQARSHTARRLATAARRAMRSGTAAAKLAADTGRLPTGRAVLPADVQAAISRLDRAVGRDVADAAYLAKSLRLRDWRDVMVLVGRANQANSRLERGIRWSVNRAYNAGVEKVTDRLGMARVWVPERDACLHCLAYAGEVAQPGGMFRGGLTFYVDPGGQRKPLMTGPVSGPPLHPNCRCRPEPWLGSEDGYGDVDYVEALKREAERAVLRGDAGVSEPARLRAVDVLLQHPALRAPKSVQDRARRAVKAGRF